MDCKHVNENLVDFLYHELESEQMDQIETHLHSCEGCAHELAAFDATRRLVGTLPELEPRALVTDRLVKEATRAVEPKRAGLWERLQVGLRTMVMHPAMTAAVVLVVVLGISFYAFRQTTPPTGEPEADNLLPVEKPSPTATFEPADETAAIAPRTAAAGKASQANEPLNQIGGGKPQLEPEPSVDEERSDRIAKTVDPARPVATRRRAKRRPRRVMARKGPGFYDSPSALKAPAGSSTGTLGSLGERGWNSGAAGTAAADDKNKLATAPRPPKRAEGRPAEKSRDLLAATPPLDAKQWLLRAEAAMKAGDCSQALHAYNQALRQQPDLRPKVRTMVDRCITVLALKGETRLRKAQQQYPSLAGFIEAAIARSQQERQAKQSKPVAPRQQKKAAPSRTSAY